MADVRQPLAYRRRRLRQLSGSERARFHAGDETLFRRLVEEHSPRLLAVVRPFAGDLDEAHDLLQETWRRVYEKRKTFSGVGTLLGWLYAVCRSVCMTTAKRKATRAGAALEVGMAHGSPSLDPGASVERAALQSSIYRAVMDLPERERDVVILRMLEGLSTREAAERMGCAEGTVKAALHHAMKRLQSSMEVWAR